mmetsp:Transcript_16142/g.18104  ORF Transcript_16142/g.18104 Transcript_16142/m.18104 type:complete len:977 (+) Transcript_16142:234-3164(+)
MDPSSSASTHRDRSQTIQAAWKHGEPNWYTSNLHNHPWICIISFIIIVVLTSFLALPKMVLAGETGREYLIWDDIRVEREDMFQLAEDEVKELNEYGEVLPLQTEHVPSWDMWIVYESRVQPTLFTVANLQHMQETEAQITSHPNYPQLCLKQLNPNNNKQFQCQPNSDTILQYFTKPYTQPQINTDVNTIATDDVIYKEAKIYLDSKFSESNQRVKYARSMYKFGAPLDVGGKRYSSFTDHEKDQIDFFRDFTEDLEGKINGNDSDGVYVFFYNAVWFEGIMNDIVMRDFLFAVLSLGFVVMYMMIHSRSVVMPLIGMGQVICAFPVAFAVYHYVFQVHFFNMMELLSIFVILGIAADDIFVYLDAWDQSKQYDVLRNAPIRRTSWVFMRAAKAMFITTFTTFCAFMATAISKIMPIAAFGIFSATLILVNYVMVVTNFAAWVVVRERCLVWWRQKRSNNLGKKDQEQGKESARDIEMSNKPVSSQNNSVDASFESSKSVTSSLDADLITPRPRRETERRVEKMGRLDRFFNQTYYPAVVKCRYGIIGIFIIWFVFAAIFASKMSAPTKEDEWIPDDHESVQGINRMQDYFPQGENDNAQKINLVWGLSGLEKSSSGNKWDPEYLGELVWDEEFDLSPTKNQQYILSICEELTQPKYSHMVKDGIVYCFMKEFKDYITSQGQTFPVPEDQFVSELNQYLDSPNGNQDKVNQRIGIVNKTDLRYVAVEVIGVGDYAPASVMEPRWERWEDFMDDKNSDAPHGLSRGFQTSKRWRFYSSEQLLVKNAIQGIFIAGGIAFVVIALSTMNIIIALYSIFVIAGIILSVMSVMYFNGWEFSIAESIAVVILIGFSVDYVVHLVHAYVESNYRSRLDRTRDALSKMGVSILGGAITTFGNGAVLFLCTGIFFVKFAWIITSTIFFALVWSLVFFPAWLIILGPENETGNLHYYYGNMKTKWQQRKEFNQRNGATSTPEGKL